MSEKSVSEQKTLEQILENNYILGHEVQRAEVIKVVREWIETQKQSAFKPKRTDKREWRWGKAWVRSFIFDLLEDLEK